jgi:cobalt-zinc-cadmium efflux system outer membrane protein
MPGAETAFEAAQIGYRQGKFDYLEVLDAQRTLFSSRTRYIQALAEYNRAVAEVERLIGTPLTEITSN